MGLRNEIQTSLADAFNNELADVVIGFVLWKKESIGDYDSETGTRQENELPHSSRGIFETITNFKITGDNVKSTDEILIVNGAEIDCVIDVDDRLITDGGIEYLVVDPRPIMGGGSTPITYEAQVRKNGN